LASPAFRRAIQPAGGSAGDWEAGGGVFEPKILNKGKLWENFEMTNHFKPSVPRRTRRHGRVRIIGGKWRSRVVEFPEALGLRPTGDRTRETLFNWLGQTLHEKNCLDLFAGSGALGFEAASRGAAKVLMLDSNPVAVSALKASKAMLQAECCEVRRMDAMAFLRQPQGLFDVVFMDPPFSSGLLAEALRAVTACLKAEGRVYIEWGEALEPLLATLPLPPWQVVKQGKAGVVHFALLCPPPRAA
jgi:16S rRNA (guanine966-N2)-methyltransferase